MIHSGYETFGLKTTSQDTLNQALVMAMARRELASVTNTESPVVAVIDQHHPAPYFNMPFSFSMNNQNYVAIDLRNFRREFAILEDNRITAIKGTTAQSLILMATLQANWTEQGAPYLLSYRLPVKSYATFIAEAITRKLGLDVNAQLMLIATFAFFYLTRSHTTSKLTEQEFRQMGDVVRRITGIAPDVLQQYQQLEGSDTIHSDIASLCQFLRTANISTRLVKISPVFIATIVSNVRFSFMNPNAILAASIEFPPIWTTLCYLCATVQHLKKNPLGDVIWRANKGDSSPEQFSKEISFHYKVV